MPALELGRRHDDLDPMRDADQPDLFKTSGAPAGLRYNEEVFSGPEENDLARRFESLPLQPFQFHGYLGNRRVASYGWRYDYASRRMTRSEALPDFLVDLKRRAGLFAKLPPEAFEQALVTEYGVGAGIGWHKDKSSFGEVVAFSFLSMCPLRFRRPRDRGWERYTHFAHPRSAYLLSGSARWEWQHSIAPLTTLRYSVTFRTLADTI